MPIRFLFPVQDVVDPCEHKQGSSLSLVHHLGGTADIQYGWPSAEVRRAVDHRSSDVGA